MTMTIIKLSIALILLIEAVCVYRICRDSRCAVCVRRWAIYHRAEANYCRRCAMRYDARWTSHVRSVTRIAGISLLRRIWRRAA